MTREQKQENLNLFRYVLLPYDLSFTCDGAVNQHNMNYWSFYNPHLRCKILHQRP